MVDGVCWALCADSLVVVEGTGQTVFGSNYGDGFATDSRVQVSEGSCATARARHLVEAWQPVQG